MKATKLLSEGSPSQGLQMKQILLQKGGWPQQKPPRRLRPTKSLTSLTLAVAAMTTTPAVPRGPALPVMPLPHQTSLRRKVPLTKQIKRKNLLKGQRFSRIILRKA